MKTKHLDESVQRLNMSQLPPEHFVDYPRELIPGGSAEKLQALSDAYFGLGSAILGHFILIFTMIMVLNSGASERADYLLPLWFLFAVLAGAVTYPSNKRIADAKEQFPFSAVCGSVTAGVFAFFGLGFVACSCFQTVAIGEMKRYGIKSTFPGPSKSKIRDRIDFLRATQEASVTHDFSKPPVRLLLP